MRWHGHAYLLWHMEEHIHTHTHTHTLSISLHLTQTLSLALWVSLSVTNTLLRTMLHALTHNKHLSSQYHAHTHPTAHASAHTHTLFPPNISFYQPTLSKCNHADPFKCSDPFLSLSHSLTYSLSRTVYTHSCTQIFMTNRQSNVRTPIRRERCDGVPN